MAIDIKPSHKGLLHKDLGVPAGKPIPAKKLNAAKADASPAEEKRIVFAENAKKWNHGDSETDAFSSQIQKRSAKVKSRRGRQ